MESKRILIVEDDEMSRLLLCESLSLLDDYEVFEADSGQKALELFHQHTFSLILLDINLPDFSGFDICSYIRQANNGHDTAIVMITGSDDPESIELAYKYGATDFVAKPINWSLIGFRLRYILRSRYNYLALKESEKRLEHALDIARLGHWELECDSDQLRVSSNLCKILGLSATTCGHGTRQFVSLIHASDQHNFQYLLKNTRQNREAFSLDTRIAVQGKDAVYVVIQGRLVDEGKKKLVGTIQDVSVQKLSQEKLTYIAHHDSLTDLPNRTLFHRLLEGNIQRSQRSGLKAALLFVDLDRFKNINDSLGHHVGDELLKKVAQRLNQTVRTYDSIARLGGDEFAIVFDSVESAHDISALTQSVLDQFVRPFEVFDYRLHIGASIGISVYPDDGLNHENLLRNADTAMYRAKSDVHENLTFYSSNLTQETIKNWSLENELREALNTGEFYLVYQPKVDLNSNQIIGLEALIRWDRQEKDPIGPAEFIPVAENTGMIDAIGKWVISNVIQQLAKWKGTSCADLPIAVNVSANQLRSRDLCTFIEAQLNQHVVDKEQFQIEITENAIVESGPKESPCQQTLNEIHDLGIKMAIDDFGTGYSSIVQLKMLPVSTLKIDKSFIDSVPENDKDVAIVLSIINFAKNLGLQVVAEGVETDQQLAAITSYGCDQVQGYVYYKPMCAHQIEQLF